MKQVELLDFSCNSCIELLRYQVDQRNSSKQHNRNGDASHKTNSPSNQTPFGGIYRRRQAARTPIRTCRRARRSRRIAAASPSSTPPPRGPARRTPRSCTSPPPPRPSPRSWVARRRTAPAPIKLLLLAPAEKGKLSPPRPASPHRITHPRDTERGGRGWGRRSFPLDVERATDARTGDRWRLVHAVRMRASQGREGDGGRDARSSCKHYYYYYYTSTTILQIQTLERKAD